MNANRLRTHAVSSCIAVLLIALLWTVPLDEFVFQSILGPPGILIEPCALNFLGITGKALFAVYYFSIAEVVQLLLRLKMLRALVIMVMALLCMHGLSAHVVVMKLIPSCSSFGCCPWLSFLP